ncbi:MAG: ABC transporter substrate-binding protein [Myxococcales bacterium]|nr:ABC transporter substrate-binding protein [Myxococcales bacterium]
MRAAEILNGSLVCLSLVAATVIMGFGGVGSKTVAKETTDLRDLQFSTTEDGRPTLLDANDRGITIDTTYSRIIAGSIVARSILGELSEKERIVGVISAGLKDAPDAHRFSGIEQFVGMNETERLLSLSPDLILVSSLSSIPHAERLRSSGIAVFTLGDMRGVESFLRDVRQISVLLGSHSGGERLASVYGRRMRSIANMTPKSVRKEAIYLSAYSTQMFGGTVGTSYHDILHYAGLVDVAADDFSGWPQYTAEHVLSMDPEIIVSPEGVPEFVCKTGALARLRACADGRAGFIELPSSWLEDPGLIMLDVAESIHEAVYGRE